MKRRDFLKKAGLSFGLVAAAPAIASLKGGYEPKAKVATIKHTRIIDVATLVSTIDRPVSMEDFT